MRETKYAELNDKQLQEIKELEEKLDITLIAYDGSVLENPNIFGNTTN